MSAAAVLLAGALAVVLLSGGAAYSQAEPAVSGAVGAPPPVAANDTLSAVSGVPVDLDVLANDYDPDGAHLYIGTSKGLIILEPVNTKPAGALAASGASAEYAGTAQHHAAPAVAPLPPFLQQGGPEGAPGKPPAGDAFADLVPPTLEYASFDAESGILGAVFNEAVRSSPTAVDLSKVHIAGHDGSNKATLANASVIENDYAAKVSIVLTEKQRSALLELAMPQLVVQLGAFADAAGNAMGADASVQISALALHE